MKNFEKKWIAFGIASIAFLAFLYFSNLSLFWVWQSAFTHANMPVVYKWFYINSSLAMLSIAVTIAFLLKGIKAAKAEKRTIEKINYDWKIIACSSSMSITSLFVQVL